ncbi:uncharacterized protein K02A2.6-like [Macrosteles quadrilineatus]|uniref:uncharacterized protein K02A2.6-like n=1 Tax=Macrosteles quadrilineatus TaxID=74068 RepID=UPI0023E09DD2|nr:uncharacterized protein K02A2.6-like [Macrosteles quadrilineatus]
MASLQGNETLSELKKARAVVKGQLTRAGRMLEELSSIKIDSIRTRLSVIHAYWERFEQIQHNIEVKTDEEELDTEITYRTDMEDMYFKIVDVLQLRLSELERVNETEELQQIRPYSVDTQKLRPLTSTISFTPFQDDETFKNFIRRLEVFIHLHGQGMHPTDKVYTLLHSLTPSLHQKVYDLCAPEVPLDKSYTELVRMLTDYVDPQPSTWALQHKFMSRVQEPNETVKIYSVELQKLTSNCEFNCESCQKSIANTLLRMQFIRGLVNKDIRAKLLQDNSLVSFQDVVKAATAMEIANHESDLSEYYATKTNRPSTVHQIEDKYKNVSTKSHMTSNQKKPSPLFESLKGKCYRCGSQNHRANNCEFASKICNKCKKQGHLARVCLGSTRTKIHQAEEEDCQDEQHEIFKIDRRNGDKIMLDLSVEGKPVQMELDTGSAISTLPYSTFKKLEINRKIFHTQVQLRTYTREVFKPKGVVFVRCTYKDQKFTGKLYIVDDNLDAIFGRDWLREVQLDWAELKAVQQYPKVGGLDNLLEKFKDVFEPGIGKIPDQLGHLQLVDGARPVFMKARPVPYALKLKVEQELDRLEEAGIISKTQESEWGTPIVPVVKPNGDVRICADYKVTVNKQIQDEHHPIPKIEDIFVNMNGGKLFCTLDLRNAYLHLEMDSDSANIQTLSTHKGQYRVHRLMFGIKVAPGIWQKTMDKTLAGLEGIQCFFDDIVIQGNSEEELLLRLESVLGKLREKGLRLNRDKCKFLQKRIYYLGHVIDEKGIHKCMDKVAALTKARKPENTMDDSLLP